MKIDVSSMIQKCYHVHLEANCRLLDRKWNSEIYKVLMDIRQAKQKGI